ncbi:hypothetical protein [Frondihabitans australicus]|uniref:hypothetical protein n=1 Tax=Frondihabitans australicus TaxID=386892 RepID=UPI0011C44FBD|nr:hypothetical protein [Frondihabitans australicus]
MKPKDSGDVALLKMVSDGADCARTIAEIVERDQRARDVAIEGAKYPINLYEAAGNQLPRAAAAESLQSWKADDVFGDRCLAGHVRGGADTPEIALTSSSDVDAAGLVTLHGRGYSRVVARATDAGAGFLEAADWTIHDPGHTLRRVASPRANDLHTRCLRSK